MIVTATTVCFADCQSGGTFGGVWLGQDCGERTEKSACELKDVDFRMRSREMQKSISRRPAE
jgi:hypothetical protein